MRSKIALIINNEMMIIRKLLDIILFINTLPFRLACGRMDRSSTISPRYSFVACYLENVFIGKNVRIGSLAWLQTVPIKGAPQPKIVIGDGTNIGRNVVISAAKKIIIGKNCLFSYNVSVVDHHHSFEDIQVSPLFQGISKPRAIEIGDNCFIGAHGFILEGVTLGKHCVVGANSVVTRSFPPFSVVAGAPARKIRTLK